MRNRLFIANTELNDRLIKIHIKTKNRPPTILLNDGNGSII